MNDEIDPTPAPSLPTAGEAQEIMRRFNASHWDLKDQEHARYRIPADHSHDDDLRMAAFINNAAATQRALADCVEALKLCHEYLIARIERSTMNQSALEGTQTLSRKVAEALDQAARITGAGNGGAA